MTHKSLSSIEYVPYCFLICTCVATTTRIRASSMHSSELNRPYFIIMYSSLMIQWSVVRVGSLKENKTMFQQFKISIKSINHSKPCYSGGAHNSITLVAVTLPPAANCSLVAVRTTRETPHHWPYGFTKVHIFTNKFNIENNSNLRAWLPSNTI